MKKLYGIYFKTIDEDGNVEPMLVDLTGDFKDSSPREAAEIIAAFLSQTDPAYVDENNIVHEIYEGKDRVFCCVFESDIPVPFELSENPLPIRL